MAKIKGSYFPNEEYFFSNDESDIVTFVEMLKNRGCYIGPDWHIRSKKGGMMSKLMRNGYYMTNAQYNKKEYYFMEHRVIWVWHNGPIPKGLVINHKDYNRANNNIDNLEVLTQKENTEYSRINYKPCRGEKSPRAMFTNAQASAIKTIAKLCGMSTKSISNLVGKPYITVMRVINGQRYPDSVSYDTIMEAYPHIVDLTRNKSISPLEELKNYSMGLCGECGEAVDILKKNLFHGKELDKTELMLELGDILYYLVAICNVLGIDVSEVALNNNAKLLNRYKEGFSKDASNNRVEEQQRGVIDGTGIIGSCMSDIRLLISMHPDSVYTNDGHKVEIVSTSAGYGHNLIYGYVHKNGKKIGHYWKPNGLFSNKIYSPVSLKVKTE